MSEDAEQPPRILDRRGGISNTERHVREATASHSPLTVLWVDIDRFQAINHSFGHAGGDLLANTIADRLADLVEKVGCVAKMSGDEFLVTLPDHDLVAGTRAAVRVREAMSRVVELQGVPIHPTVSTGVAVLEDGEDVTSLLLRADRAKQEAKAKAGHTYAISSQSDSAGSDQHKREEIEIEAKLYDAIETGGLSLHYQPIIGAQGHIEAIEALIRCTVRGEDIPPVKLIPVAEKSPLITRIGDWTMFEGAAFARKLFDDGFQIKVAVNVSRAQLLGAGFLDALHAAIFCAGIEPHLLELELTESLFLDPSDVVQQNLQGARDSGVSLAIDDFGTGYSALGTLMQVPASKLKLDRAFIRVMPEDHKAIAIVRAMAGLGRELGMTVVAEGVETREQYDCLSEIGVDAVQGYLYARPMPGKTMLSRVVAARATNSLPFP